MRLRLLIAFLFAHVAALAASCSTTTVGSFTCRQSYANVNASGTNTYTMPSTLGASPVLIGGIHWQSNSITLTSMSGCGATWTLFDNPASGGAAQRAAGFMGLGASGSCTITLTFSSNVVNALTVHELGGADTTTPIGSRHADSTCNACGTTTDVVTAGPVTASGTDYVFGSSSDFAQGVAISGGTGFTRRESVANISGAVASEDKSASGSNSATFTDTNASQYNATVVLSVAVSSGGAAVVVPRPPISF